MTLCGEEEGRCAASPCVLLKWSLALTSKAMSTPNGNLQSSISHLTHCATPHEHVLALRFLLRILIHRPLSPSWRRCSGAWLVGPPLASILYSARTSIPIPTHTGFLARNKLLAALLQQLGSTQTAFEPLLKLHSP